MSLTEDKRNRIKYYLMEKIFTKQENMIDKTADTFQVSRQTVYKYLNELIDNKDVKKIGNGKYQLVRKKAKTYTYMLKEKQIEEDVIYNETLRGYIETLEDNVKRIWQYGFTEMVNNAIDHSEANTLKIFIAQNALYTWVNIMDDGIGIFEKIARYYQYDNLNDAVLNLFKGKLTTDAKNHSGEGIFFTSRVMEHFGAISSNKIFSQDNTHEVFDDLKNRYKDEKIKRLADLPGTVIIMALSNNVDRTLKEVFDMYSSIDGGFTTTSIPIKQTCDGGYPVSRSQAKRLYFGFDKFEKVILDFSGVKDIGQGFAHELFNVFAKEHPEIKIECVNVNDDVQKMINHVSIG